MTGIPFKTFPGDPIHVQQYRLHNGMQVYISVHTDEPRIFTNIAVRAGSKNDPPDTTGLAHYLEHMMFKGTSKIGALDWKKEKVLLRQIAELYEQHRRETDPDKRLEIYRRIDQLSGQAARYVAANEYDRLMTELGAKQTNAYTWLDQTVFVNDIPSNELERWMQIESERFGELVLRLFHTELETVYEEFNISQDRDFRKVYKEIKQALFPNHPYHQDTLGEGSHLKNPSHVAIHKFFDTYYRPNNMALVLAGDLDPEETIRLAEKYFGRLKPAPIPPFDAREEPPIEAPIRRIVRGQEAAYVELAWRFPSAQWDKAPFLHLVKALLYNRTAGLIDLDLIQSQRLLEAYAYLYEHADYSLFMLHGTPRQGQDLETVENLLLKQIERLAQADFPDDLIPAVVTNYRYRQMKNLEKASHRAHFMTQAYVLGLEWPDLYRLPDRMEAITKQELADFVRDHFRQNYVSIHKITADDPNVVKVEKPPITPLTLNRRDHSAFAKEIFAQSTPDIAPTFVDFNRVLQRERLDNGVPLYIAGNPHNPTFSLRYVFDMGKTSSKRLKLALDYLPLIGTDRYSPEALQQAFFRAGVSFSVYTSQDELYIKLDGPESGFEQGVELVEHLIANAAGDRERLDAFVQNILKSREDNKQDKSKILYGGMLNYGFYGPTSPFTDRLSADELLTIRPDELTGLVHGLFDYEHHAYFYGSLPAGKVKDILNKYHRQKPTRPALPARTFPEQDTPRNRVFLVDFPMVQAEILLVRRVAPHFDLNDYLLGGLWNEYFGLGMSAVIFQELREAKGLAYSTYAYYRHPDRKDKGHFLTAFVGTQPDKLETALTTLRQLLDDFPLHENAIKKAIQTTRKKIASSRIKPDDYYWTYQRYQKLGFSRDLRKDRFDFLQTVKTGDLVDFHDRRIRHKPLTYFVLGDKQRLDMAFLESLGQVRELSLETLFGY